MSTKPALVPHNGAPALTSQQLADRFTELSRTVNDLLETGRQLREQLQAQGQPRPADSHATGLRLLELLRAAGGKLTTEQLQEKANLTKSAAYYQVGLLEQAGLVVTVRPRRDPKTGRRGPDWIYHHEFVVLS